MCPELIPVELLLKSFWLRTYYFVYWQTVFFSWGKRRTIHWLCTLCHSSQVFLVVYCDRLYLFWDQQKLQRNIFLHLAMSVYLQLLTLVHCQLTHIVGNQFEQDKSNFVFPENCRDVNALIFLLSSQYWKEEDWLIVITGNSWFTFKNRYYFSYMENVRKNTIIERSIN